MFLEFVRKIFGTRNDRILKGLRPLVNAVNELEREVQVLSDDQLRAKTGEFKQRIERGESLDAILAEAFAVVREASVRTLGMRHFDVQLIGGMVLHQGKVAEMKTGEGKTLAATLPAYLNALSGGGVHIVTVNDYLARRDAEWMGQLYNFLGLSVGCVFARMDEDVKRQAYRADITYGQNNEFGFDYLRDNMKFSTDEMFQRGHSFAIVDEVDSILIDEARTPLIISGPAEDSTDKYITINKVIPRLKEEEHFTVDLKTKNPALTEEGVAKAEELLQIDNLYDPRNIEFLHHMNQALKAHTTLHRDVDYVVRNGEVIIVDEFTGRLMPGRRWSDGLHQAVEAKENVKVARENQTLASITFQNYFRMYDKLSGMTGTADTEAVELMQIYNLEVVVIPTNRPLIRDDQSDVVFRTTKEKYEAVIEEIEERNKTGQPILVGTVSIDQSERLSQLLSKKGITHNVLNAKAHEREAEIVAQAGRFGAVTISTNMAGRGTDIVLGGNPGFLAQDEAGTSDPEDPTYKEALERFSRECAEEREQVLEAGGLMIMGTERHESRRIDNQLRGRAGRQGDPGVSRFYISLEDDLMKRFGGDKLQTILRRFGWEEGIAIDGRLISRSIESAQERVERFHFEARKHVTEYDDVMNKQRQVVYNLRSKILFGEDVRSEILDMIDDLLEEDVLQVCNESVKPTEWNLAQLQERFQFLFNAQLSLDDDIELSEQAIFDTVRAQAKELFQNRVQELQQKLDNLRAVVEQEDMVVEGVDDPFSFETIERNTLLETLDHFWNIHLQQMDFLREGIGLRGYGQKNPLHEYQREGFILFQQMMLIFKENAIRKLFFFKVQETAELMQQIEAERQRREAMAERMKMVHDSPLEPGEGDASSLEEVPRDPDEQREKLEAQRKARRRKRKRR